MEIYFDEDFIAKLEQSRNTVDIRNQQEVIDPRTALHNQLMQERASGQVVTPVGKQLEHLENKISGLDRFEGMPSHRLEDASDWRAEQQSRTEKWAGAPLKFISMAGTTVLDNTVGFFWGLAEAAAGGSFIDNSFSNKMQDFQQWVEELAPLYSTQAYEQSPWYQKLGHANWWVESVANQGFTAGVVASSALWAGTLRSGLQAFKYGRGLTGAAQGGKLKGITDAARAGKITAEGVTKEIIGSNTFLKNADVAIKWIASAQGSASYARTEALSHGRQLEQELLQKLDMDFSENIDAIVNEVQMGLLDSNPELLENPEELDKLTKKAIAEQYDEKVNLVSDILRSHINTVFARDLFYLTITNMAMFGNVYSGNYGLQRNVLSKKIAPKAGREALKQNPVLLKEGIEKVAATKASKYGVPLAHMMKNPVVQFFEESFLHINRESSGDFHKAMLDEDATMDMAGYNDVWFDKLKNTFGSIDEWESGMRGFFGALLGAAGPVNRGGKIKGYGMHGGIWDAVRSVGKDPSVVNDALINSVNEILSSEERQAMYRAAVRRAYYDKEGKNDLELGHKTEYENSEAKKIISDILLFDQIGMLQEFVDFMTGGENMDASQIRDLFKIVKAQDGTPLATDDIVDIFEGKSDTEVKKIISEGVSNVRKFAESVIATKENLDIRASIEGWDPKIVEAAVHHAAMISHISDRIQKSKTNLPFELQEIGLQHVNNKENTEVLNTLMEQRVEASDRLSEGDKAKQEKWAEEYVNFVKLNLYLEDAVSKYEKLSTEEGRKSYIEEVQKAYEAAQKRNEELLNEYGIAEEVGAVADNLKPVIAQTLLKEDITLEDGSSTTVTHKGVVSITSTDDAGNKTTSDFRVEDVNLETGEVLVTKLDRNKEGRLVNTSHQLIITGDKVVSAKDPNQVRGLEGIKIAQTAQQAKDATIIEAAANTFSGAANLRIQELQKINTRLEGLSKIQNRISESIKTATTTKTKKAGISLEDTGVKKGLQEILPEAGITKDIENKARLVLNLTQLQHIYDTIEKIKDTVTQDAITLQEELNKIETVIGNTNNESLKKSIELLKEVQTHYEEVKSSIEASQNTLENTIENLKKYLRGLYTRLENLNGKKNSTVTRLRELLNEGELKGGVLLTIVEDELAELEKTLGQEIKFLMDKRIISSEDKLLNYDEQRQELENNLKEVESKLRDIKEDLNKVERQLKAFTTQYNFLVGAQKEGVAHNNLLDTQGVENLENEQVDGVDGVTDATAPREPFTGNIFNLTRSTVAQHIHINEVKNNNDTHEPELLYQDFIDFYNPDTKVTDSNYRQLHLYNINKFLDAFKESLTEKQIKRMEQDAANFPDAIISIIVDKAGNPVLQDALVDPSRKSLMYSKINGVNRDAGGNPINERFGEKGHELVDLSAYSTDEAVALEKFREVAEEYASLLKFINTFDKPVPAKIIASSAGVVLRDQEGVLNNPMDVIGVAKPQYVKIVVGKGENNLKSGYVYVQHNGVNHRVTRQLLREEDADRVLEFVIHTLQQKTMAAANDVLTEIDKITHFTSEKKGRTSGKYHTMYFATSGTGSTATIKYLVYGNNQRLELSDIGNAEKLAEFKEFLTENKYYQIGDKYLTGKEFTTFRLKDGKLVQDKTYSAKDGGYKAYLLARGEEKILSIEKEKNRPLEERVKNPNRLNRSLYFQVPQVQDKQLDKNNEVKRDEKKVATIEDTEDFGKREEIEGLPAEFIEDTPPPLTDKDITVETVDQETGEIKDVKIDTSDEELAKHSGLSIERIREIKANDKASGNKGLLRVSRGIGEPRQNLSVELERFREMFPDFVVDIIRGNTITGKVEGRFHSTKDSARIILASNAAQGSLYHEAWHNVSNLFMTQAERDGLYNETRTLLGNREIEVQEGGLSEKISTVKGKDMTDAQVEEYLAEEFRNFMLVGKDNYKFNSQRKQNFFTRIWQALKRLLLPKKYWNAPTNVVEQKFAEVASKKFFMKDRVRFETIDLNKVGNLKESTAAIYTSTINYNFFKILRTNEVLNTYPDLYSDVNKYAPVIYQLILEKFRAVEPADLVNPILENWQDLVKHHSKFIAQYNIKFDVDKMFDENPELKNTDSSIKDNSQMIESNTIDLREKIPVPIKLLVAGLPQGKMVDGEFTPTTKFGVYPQTVDPGRTLHTLFKNLSNTEDIGTMVGKVRELANTTNPEFSVLLEQLGVDTEDVLFKPGISKTQADMQIAFVTTFNNAMNDYISVSINDKGDIYTISNEKETSRRKLLDMWRGNVRKNASTMKGLFKEEGDDFIINKEHPVKLGAVPVPLKEISSGKIGTLAKSKDAQIKLYKQALGYLGIELSDGVKDYDVLKNAVDFIFKGIREGKDNLTINDIFNKDEVKANKELNQLIVEEGKVNPLVGNLQIYTGSGISEYALMQKNRISKVIDRMNEHLLDKGMKPFDPKTGEGNLGTYNSVWLDYTSDNKIGKVLLRNFGKDVGDKTDISELGRGDFIRTEFNAMLEGIFPFLRAEGRKLEYAFNFGKDYVQTNVDSKPMLERYLLAEIMEALDINNNPDAKRLVKRGKHLGLGVFKDMLPNLSNAVQTVLVEGKTDYERAAKELMKQYKKDIDVVLDRYIEENINNTLEYFIDNKFVIQSEESYEVLGINPEILQKFLGVNSPILTKEQMEKLINVFNHYYLQSAMEQSKLIFGSPLVYLKKGVSDLHKRTTTFASTVSPVVNTSEFVDYLNKNYKRADGHQHQEYYVDAVLGDVVVDSPVNALYKAITGMDAYKSIEKNDGQGYSLPDGYRSLEIRGNNWNDAKERSWQYMMQLAGQYFVNEGYRPQEWFRELFGEHLPEKPQKGKAYFNGEEVVMSKENFDGGIVSALPNLKPQGTGQILNKEIIGNNAVQISKLSIALINPLDFLNNKSTMLFLLKAMDQGIDFVVPSSAKKGEILGDIKGKVPEMYNADGTLNATFNSEEISWNDIGNQTEIDPSGKNKVTLSTQLRRIGFIDTFFDGKPLKGFEHLQELAAEYNSHIEELVKRKLVDLTKDMGLSESSENVFTLEDSNKLKSLIKKQIEARQQPDNIALAVDIVMESSLKLFDTVPTKAQLENIMMGLVRNNVITLKVNGDMLTQESSVIHSASEILNPYLPLDADGNPITNSKNLKKAVSVAPAETMLTLPTNMIKYVEGYGKGTFEENLALFNEDVAKGKFKEIFTFVANRVPTDHLHSVEVLRAIKFLHPLGGSKVIIGSEIVAKTSSDFDIDKLTSYFNNIEFNSSGVPSYIQYEKGKENSTAAIENRMNEILKAVILDVNNLSTLLKPNSSEIVKKAASKVKTDVKDIVDVHKLLEFPYNVEVGQKQWGSLSLVAVAAINIVSHATTQMHPISVNKKLFRFLFEDFSKVNSNKERVYMGHHKDSDGNIISDNNGATATAALDSGKENYPNIAKINYTMSTYAAYQMLNRLGSTKLSPIGFEKLTKFFTLPAITEYEKLRTNEESDWLMVNGKSVSKEATALNIVNKYREIEGKPKIKAKDLLYQKASRMLKTQGEELLIAKKELSDALDAIAEEDYLNFSRLEGNQSTALQYFLYYQELGKVMRMFHMATRPDSGLTKSRNSLKIKQLNLERLRELNFFNKNDIDALFSESYIGTFKNAQDKALQMLAPMFIVDTDSALNDFVWGSDGIMSTFINPELAKSEEILERISHKVENSTLNYILHTTPVNNVALNSYYKNFFKGDNSIANRLQKIKERVPDNLAVKEMVSMVKEFDAKAQKNSDIDYVKIYNKRFTVQESNSFTNSLRELIEHTDADIVEFGEDLVRMAILQSGVQRSPISFFELLPAETYHKIAGEIIESYLQKDKVILGDAAKDDVMANLAHDRDVVPNHSVKGRNFGELMNNPNILSVWNKNQNSNYEYLTVTLPVTNFEKLEKEGKPVPKTTMLYKRVYESGTDVIFERIEMKGRGMKMYEAGKPKSIVAANNAPNITGVPTEIVINKVKVGSRDYSISDKGVVRDIQTGKKVTDERKLTLVNIRHTFQEARSVKAGETSFQGDVYVRTDGSIISMIVGETMGKEILTANDRNTLAKRTEILDLVDERLGIKKVKKSKAKVAKDTKDSNEHCITI
jgi:hypothetical protein